MSSNRLGALLASMGPRSYERGRTTNIVATLHGASSGRFNVGSVRFQWDARVLMNAEGHSRPHPSEAAS